MYCFDYPKTCIFFKFKDKSSVPVKLTYAKLTVSLMFLAFYVCVTLTYQGNSQDPGPHFNMVPLYVLTTIYAQKIFVV